MRRTALQQHLQQTAWAHQGAPAAMQQVVPLQLMVKGLQLLWAWVVVQRQRWRQQQVQLGAAAWLRSRWMVEAAWWLWVTIVQAMSTRSCL